jgi:hypothetical protein
MIEDEFVVDQLGVVDCIDRNMSKRQEMPISVTIEHFLQPPT